MSGLVILWTDKNLQTIIIKQKIQREAKTMAEEKWITIVYGDGASARIPERALPKAQEAAEYLRNAAKKKGSGFTPEEADRIFTLQIVKDED